jgi:RNA polymerase sigma-70 factor (ECF subfamily)
MPGLSAQRSFGCLSRRPSSHALPNPKPLGAAATAPVTTTPARPLTPVTAGTLMTGAIGTMEACIPALRRYACTLLRDRQEVDDLVHDCLVRALDRLHTRRTDTEIRPWLFAIMHNLYVSRMRRRRTRNAAESRAAADACPHATSTPQEVQVHTSEVIAEVQRLPEDLRSVLLLITLEDLTYAQVADILNIPIGTVMSRLSRARERLRQRS